MFDEVARILRGGGWFAFSTEECTGSEHRLLPTGRYAQSHAYIARLAKGRFEIVTADQAAIRVESQSLIPGRLYVLQKS